MKIKPAKSNRGFTIPDSLLPLYAFGWLGFVALLMWGIIQFVLKFG